MASTDLPTRTELRGHAATVHVEYGPADHARFSVRTDGDVVGAASEGARLAGEAVHQARVRHALRLETVLEVATPATGLILEALRRRRGNDLERIVLRRAGSSVLVTLDLRPWPAVARAAADLRHPVLPTQADAHRPHGARPVSPEPALAATPTRE